MKYKFSGHETFQCRHFWLKKGYDFLVENKDFSKNEALIDLGVGKNMITSIKHWLKAFEIIDENSDVTELGHYFFDDEKGKDPYLEDLGTLNILHFNLINNFSQSSIYRLVFQDFRTKRITLDFTTDQVYDFISKRLISEGEAFSEKSLRNDINVFLKTYQTSTRKKSKSLEDDYASILIELNLIDEVSEETDSNKNVYRIRYDERRDLDSLIYLYGVSVTFQNHTSISVEDIQKQVGDKFLCNREGTESKLQDLQEAGLLVYKQDAGRKEVQFKEKLNPYKILNQYYGRV